MKEQVEEFVIDFTSQKEWGGLIAVAFFLAGVGSGAFFLAMLLAGYSHPGLVDSRFRSRWDICFRSRTFIQILAGII